jgi:hypothetical protein
MSELTGTPSRTSASKGRKLVTFLKLGSDPHPCLYKIAHCRACLDLIVHAPRAFDITPRLARQRPDNNRRSEGPC